MSWYETASLIVSVLSLIASGFVSFTVFYMGRKVEDKRYRADIEYQARKFIIKHGDSEMLYIPYCVIASCVNRHHKHLRQIYNDFDALPNAVQREVLKQAGYDYQLIENNDWVNDSLKEIEDFAAKYDLGDTFLYDGEKYFRRAFECHSAAITSKYHELEPLYEDRLEWCQGIAKSPHDTDRISFSSYIESYYRTFVLGENEKGFKKDNVIRPLDYLKIVNDFQNCDEEKLCFWIMVSVGELAYYVIRTRHGGYRNDFEIQGAIYRGEAESATFEDMYYETLMKLYELEVDKYTIESKKERHSWKNHKV